MYWTLASAVVSKLDGLNLLHRGILVGNEYDRVNVYKVGNLKIGQIASIPKHADNFAVSVEEYDDYVTILALLEDKRTFIAYSVDPRKHIQRRILTLSNEVNEVYRVACEGCSELLILDTESEGYAIPTIVVGSSDEASILIRNLPAIKMDDIDTDRWILRGVAKIGDDYVFIFRERGAVEEREAGLLICRADKPPSMNCKEIESAGVLVRQGRIFVNKQGEIIIADYKSIITIDAKEGRVTRRIHIPFNATVKEYLGKLFIASSNVGILMDKNTFAVEEIVSVPEGEVRDIVRGTSSAGSPAIAYTIPLDYKTEIVKVDVFARQDF